MGNKVLLAFLAGVLILINGCIVYPDKYVARFGIKARLVDENDAPISTTHVSVTVDDKRFSTRTNKEGMFKVRPGYSWYITWTICGPIVAPTRFSDIVVSTKGYEGYEMRAYPEWGPDRDRAESALLRPCEADYLLLGDIRLSKAKL